MRIDQVRAGAFGPLRGERLTLAPGFTVVHGPNETGKSSWFAATYAGLVGRRKARGRGTAAQAAFAQRHKPWSGSQWSAGVTLTLDDGTTLALEHDLRTAEGRALDVTTGRPVAVAALERRLGRALVTEGALDGSRILGLNREIARSTVFVPQADVLRVMQDASELQELLERVATTETADVTAEAALQWLARTRSERVGVAHVGSRPLRRCTLAAAEARETAVRTRDRLAQLLRVLAEQKEVEAKREEAARQMERLERAQRWRALLELERRVDQVRQLTAVAADDQPPPANDALVRRVTVVLGGYDDRGEPPTPPDGLDAAALQVEIAQLPEVPQGDLEPRAEVVRARDALAEARAVWLTHQESAPDAQPIPTVPADAEQLRDLAVHLEAPSPVVDPELEERVRTAQKAHRAALAAHSAAEAEHLAAAERNRDKQRTYEQRLAAYRRLQEEFTVRVREYDATLADRIRGQAEAAATGRRKRTMATGLLVGGGALTVVGVVLLVVGQVVLGAALAAAGVVVAAAALVSHGRTTAAGEGNGGGLPDRPTAPTPPDVPDFEVVDPPVRPDPDPSTAELEARLASQRLAIETHERNLVETRSRLADLGLPADPAELRRLARALDDAEDAARRRDRHEEQARQLAARRRDARAGLAVLLGVTLGDEDDEEALDAAVFAAFHEYVEGCRQRAHQAAAAARRADLQQALEQRVEMEQSYARAVAERERHETTVLTLGAELGAPLDDATATEPATVESVAVWLRGWLAEQEARRAHAADERERTGRLEQLLDGRTVDDLEQEVATAREELGPEPEHVPEDLEDQLRVWGHRHEGLVGQAGDLRGQQSQLTAGLPAVAQVLEHEAAADRALVGVQELARGLELATAQLEKAKERSHASVAPAIEQTVRPWVPRVTQGRYLDVKVNPADLTMKVTQANGAVRDAHLLSHGTTEQLYLLLRLALAQHLASADETAPLLLDDVTVQSDRERTWAVLDLLHQVSAERQVVLFSQEDEVVAWAEQHLREPRDQLVPLPPAT